jgi:hypothetical protein
MVAYQRQKLGEHRTKTLAVSWLQPVQVMWCDQRIEAQFQLRYDIFLTAVGLTRGGSRTVHIYTQTIQRTTQSTQTIHRTTQLTNWEESGPYPFFASYTLAFALQLRKKNGKFEKTLTPHNSAVTVKPVLLMLFNLALRSCCWTLFRINDPFLRLLTTKMYGHGAIVGHTMVLLQLQRLSNTGDSGSWTELMAKYAANSSKPPVTNYQSIRSHNSEECNHQI